MNDFSSPPISDERDEYPEITQADLDRAVFRVGLKPAPRRQSITLSLDSNLVDYFKSKAGERGYQTLMSEALRQAKESEESRIG
uniref:BrnA antitoxin of type II toxin-antitoxin system n=1 Tax=Candidatus Kentrum sp. DK TaxID=2126562 RepID=A0A450SKG1_9GAMM|nr:MAG: BrnA antitoxin of type II toxin-antitoxin system [Candidatus Kentron sp. DK]VFJ53985.1 MAG: BrnA antitoxin of type II toxin-antitoxin system [Candidatus Kentron sp. DK]